jgi:nucleoid-associated protein YgaU
MGIRNNGRSTKSNSNEAYEELFESRNVKQIEHLRTPKFSPISLADRYSLVNEHHVWTTSDRYWKLASKYYGDGGLWWLIAWYNQKPTDAHVNIGDSLAIPLPLSRALTLFRR